MTNFQEVLTAARSLDATEQVLLVSTISDELAIAGWPIPDPEVLAESERRTQDYLAGKTKASSFDDVLARARKAAGIDE